MAGENEHNMRSGELHSDPASCNPFRSSPGLAGLLEARTLDEHGLRTETVHLGRTSGSIQVKSVLMKMRSMTQLARPAGARGVLLGGMRVGGARRLVSVWRPLVSTFIALLLVGLLSGGGCIVVYCTEDCDPCLVQYCKCSVCDYTANHETVHRLDAYDLTWVADSRDRVTRIYANILGLSLDRALGAKPHSSDDLAKFARHVLVVNAGLFRVSSSAGRWVLDGVEHFEGSRVVSFHESMGGESSVADETATVAFLFDGRGNLVEIDHTLR